MSARARIVVESRPDALKVPNDALRFRADVSAMEQAPAPRVWRVGADGRAAPVDVEVGVSDGSATEIVAASAAPILRAGVSVGKFHGVKAATTPTGSCTTSWRLLPISASCWPCSLASPTT
jgi:hypothetical protein